MTETINKGYFVRIHFQSIEEGSLSEVWLGEKKAGWEPREGCFDLFLASDPFVIDNHWVFSTTLNQAIIFNSRISEEMVGSLREMFPGAVIQSRPVKVTFEVSDDD